MDFERDEFVEAADAREEIITLLSEEMEAARRRLLEVKETIENVRKSVEREQSSYSSIAAELRTIKDNLDTVPREDIRDKYDEALDVRFRLATMRGQLEKLESNYQLLEERQTLMGRVLGKIQGGEFLPDADMDMQDASRLDIVGIIRAQEEERQRLARAMHDGPAQSMTNFILQAEICQRLFDRDPERAATELGNLKTDASKTFQKIRDFIFDLRPMMLDDLGVAPTVRRYVESFSEKNDIEISLSIKNDERRLENYREVLIFRSIQALLGAARDYANPTEIEVQLDLHGDTLRVVVEDDGAGFDASLLDEDRDDEHFDNARIQSLAMLKGQFELVQGQVDVRSSDNGTIVKLQLPAI